MSFWKSYAQVVCDGWVGLCQTVCVCGRGVSFSPDPVELMTSSGDADHTKIENS